MSHVKSKLVQSFVVIVLIAGSAMLTHADDEVSADEDTVEASDSDEDNKSADNSKDANDSADSNTDNEDNDDSNDEAEKTEVGEASYNVQDCVAPNEQVENDEKPEHKELDECEKVVK